MEKTARARYHLGSTISITNWQNEPGIKRVYDGNTNAVAILKLGHEEFDLRARHEFRKNERCAARFLSAAPLERARAHAHTARPTCSKSTPQVAGRPQRAEIGDKANYYLAQVCLLFTQPIAHYMRAAHREHHVRRIIIFHIAT